MYKLLIFSLFVSFAYSLDIDIESFKQEAQNDPSNINARIILAREYINNKKYDEAKVSLDEVLALKADHKKAIKLMKELTEKKNPKETDEERYKKILEKRDDVDTAIKLYDLYIKENRKAEAKRLKMRYWRKSINNPVYLALENKEQTILFARAGKLESIYKKSHQFSDFKEYYYELEGLGYKDKGFLKLEEFVKNNPQNEEAVLFLANQYYWNKRSKESIDILKPVIENDTKNIEILTLYANLLYQAGENQKALKEFKKVVALGSNDPKILQSIKSIKKHKKAYRKTKQSSKTENLRYLAEKYFSKKKYRKSLPLYKKYFQRVSNDSNTRFHYATALENVKQYKKAEKQYLIVSKQMDKLHLLSTYRYARVMIAQREEQKWDRARDVLADLLETILNGEKTKESDDILKYTQQSLDLLSKPMPKATMHKDVMLTESQSKILGQSTFSESSIQNQHVSSIKGMINPNLSAISSDTTIQVSPFITMLNDNSVHNRGYGVTIANQSMSLTAKNSTFKNDDEDKKLDVATLKASYSNGDNFSISLGVNSFDDSTDVVGKMEFRKAYKNHNITYGLGYESGIFINGAICSVENDINAITLSLYDLILLKNLEEAEATLVINSFSDSNLNINSWVNYPLYRAITQSLENSFSLIGSYEYNSKKDTCYGATDFFDTTQIEMISKYQFSTGFFEAKGSVGYSFKNSEVVYSYGFMLQVMASNSLDVSIDCRHYQSGYSPDGANECYASFTRVW
jgi:thioredoxin-like negative regulator of GroEL